MLHIKSGELSPNNTRIYKSIPGVGNEDTKE